MNDPDSNNLTQDDHERRDVSVPVVAGFGFGLIIFLLIIFVVVRWMVGAFVAHRANEITPSHPVRQTALPPEPRLQSNPPWDLARFREHENFQLNNYSWIDRKAGIVRIPIDQALDLIVQRGLPKPPSTSINKTPLQMRQEKGLPEKRLP